MIKDVLLQLCFEDDCEYGKANGDSQTHVQVEQDGANKCDQPHKLRDKDIKKFSATAAQQAVFKPNWKSQPHQVNLVSPPQQGHVHKLLEHSFQIHKNDCR